MRFEGVGHVGKHLKTGSAYYAPLAAAVEMVSRRSSKDKKKILREISMRWQGSASWSFHSAGIVTRSWALASVYLDIH